MLMNLIIKNVVLIDHLVIDFKGGLCAMTGETGAGKSILLDSLGLALGVRAESGLVRSGKDSASVTASFQIPDDHGAYAILRHADINIDDDVLLMRRVVYNSGKSRAFINDQPVSVGLLRQVGDTLVEIHGQFETQGLLNPQTHRSMLDEYAKIKGSLSEFWNNWKDQEQALDDLYKMSERAHREEEYLRISLEDLEKLSPDKGEEEDIAKLRDRLKYRESVLEALSNVSVILGNENDPVQKAWAELDKIAGKADDKIEDAIAALSRASFEIAEADSIIQTLSSDLQDSDANLEEIDDRLYALRMQARKHNCSVDDLVDLRDKISDQLNMIEHADDVLQEQKKKCSDSRKSYIEQAEKISAKRKLIANKLNKLVQKELIPLKLEKARFITQVDQLDEVEWNAYGMDRVRFLVSTNPGREAGPIHKIASGGEMSRFMLALKVVIAQSGSTHSFIFDEVDTGVGGATADAVGERLAVLADSKQVLVVTHAPQVAARADHHWIVKKSGKGEVKTDIIPLKDRAERCEEIARMLAGANITAEARAAANKLLDNAA